MSDYRGSIAFEGYGRFSNTGQTYRKWKFTDPVPELEIEAGLRLFDTGPETTGARFTVRDFSDGNWNRLKTLGRDQVKLIIGYLPSWDPETWYREQETSAAREGWKRIEGLTSLVSAAVSRDSAGSRGGRSRSLRRSSGASRVVGCLELAREDRYGNTGGRFRIWRFREDRPEIPASDHNRTGGPAHAVEGDELWQEPDRLTPWRLKRDDMEIGNPEHWQVRGAFGGTIPGWGNGEDEHSADQEPDTEPDLTEARNYFSLNTADGGRFAGGDYPRHTLQGAYRFRAAEPEIGAEAGDVLIYAWNEESRPDRIYGRVRGLEVDEIETLREVLRERSVCLRNSIPEMFECLTGGEEEMVGSKGKYGWGRSGLARFLHNKNRWGGKLAAENFYHRLLLVKPYREKVTRPIRAQSDEGAAWELLAQVTDEVD